MNLLEFAFITVAAVAAGFVNAVAGGGTLVSFPALMAVGLPALDSRVTSAVALTPGYLGGALAQRREVRDQWSRVRLLAPISFVGGLAGGALLLVSSDEVLELLVPFLILAACALLAGQDRVRDLVYRRRQRRGTPPRSGHGVSVGAAAALFAASVYGGYFGGGLGIVLLAVLGSVLPDDLREINALKQTLALVVNLTAATFFLFSGRVWWLAGAIMAVGALGGGHLGGRVASRLDALVLRRVVVISGVIIAGIYLVG